MVTGAFEYWVEENFPRAIENLTSALELGRERGDIISVVLSRYHAACALLSDCQFPEALSHIEKALDINSAVNNLWGVSVMKSHQSLIHGLDGQIKLSQLIGHEALDLAEQSGDIYSKCMHTRIVAFPVTVRALLKKQ